MTETNELATRPSASMAFEITKARMDELREFVDLTIQGGFAPKQMTTPAGVCSILYGLELGLSAMQSLQQVAVINGRPSIFGDAALSLVLASGKIKGTPVEEWEGKPNTDDFRAVCTVHRVGADEPVRKEFSIAMAKKAKLWGKAGPWTSYPARMLQMRALAWALRGAFADVLNGMGIREEVQDFEMNSGSRKAPETIDLEVIAAPEKTIDPIGAIADPDGNCPAGEYDGGQDEPAPDPDYQADRQLQEEERESLLQEDSPMPTNILLDKCDEAGIDTSAFRAALGSKIPMGDVRKIATEMERKLAEV